jgi:DNA-binding GntR family transcriptional regulator
MVVRGESQPSTLERDTRADEGVDHGLMARSEGRAGSNQVAPPRPDAAVPGRATPGAGGKGSMKDSIVSQLRQEIASGTIAFGEKLSEARLAQRFGVSRMPVREALKELEAAGFVAIEHRRGTFVRRLSRREILDLYEVREAVECMAARLCAGRATNEVVALIDEVMLAMGGAVRNGDADGYIATDERLHELIMQGAGNAPLADYYRLLVQQLHRGLLSSIVTRREGRMERSLAEHEAIVGAIRARDAQAAEAAMRAHVQQGRLELADEVQHKFAL